MTNAVDLAALEQKLAPFTHGPDALHIIQDALRGLKPRARQDLLNEHLLCAPIYHDHVKNSLPPDVEQFLVLQGDVIRTEAAYYLGTRLIAGPSFVVATSTCDIIPDRRKTALLLQVEPKRKDYASVEEIKNHLGGLTLFKPTRYFYLPPLPDDDPDVLYNLGLMRE